MEYYNSYLWANIFTRDTVIQIDAENGKVVRSINMKSLKMSEQAYNNASNSRMDAWDYGNNVLNGIAVDQSSGDFFFYGKRWSLLFRV